MGTSISSDWPWRKRCYRRVEILPCSLLRYAEDSICFLSRGLKIACKADDGISKKLLRIEGERRASPPLSDRVSCTRSDGANEKVWMNLASPPEERPSAPVLSSISEPVRVFFSYEFTDNSSMLFLANSFRPLRQGCVPSRFSLEAFLLNISMLASTFP